MSLVRERRRVATRITVRVDAPLSQARELIEEELKTPVSSVAPPSELYSFEARPVVDVHEDGDDITDRVVHCLERAGLRVGVTVVTLLSA